MIRLILHLLRAAHSVVHFLICLPLLAVFYLLSGCCVAYILFTAGYCPCLCPCFCHFLLQPFQRIYTHFITIVPRASIHTIDFNHVGTASTPLARSPFGQMRSVLLYLSTLPSLHLVSIFYLSCLHSIYSILFSFVSVSVSLSVGNTTKIRFRPDAILNPLRRGVTVTTYLPLRSSATLKFTPLYAGRQSTLIPEDA